MVQHTKKAWVMFAGTIISSAVIEKSADNFQTGCKGEHGVDSRMVCKKRGIRIVHIQIREAFFLPFNRPSDPS